MTSKIIRSHNCGYNTKDTKDTNTFWRVHPSLMCNDTNDVEKKNKIK